jgi:hypothetical protein
VRLTPASGELALVGSHSEAQAQAEAYMRRQCPYGYEVLEEGEGRVSVDPWSSPSLGAARSNGSSAFEQSEWRIRYHCRGQSGAAPSPSLASVASAAKAPPGAPAPPTASPQPSAPPPAPSASAPSNWF